MIPRPAPSQLDGNGFAFRFWLDACHAITLAHAAGLDDWARQDPARAQALVLEFARLGTPGQAAIVRRGSTRGMRIVVPPAWDDASLAWCTLIGADVRPDDRVLAPARAPLARGVLALGATLVRCCAGPDEPLHRAVQEEGITLLIVPDGRPLAEDPRWDTSSLRATVRPMPAPWRTGCGAGRTV